MFPSIAQLKSRAKKLGVGQDVVSIVENKLWCSNCNDMGYWFATHEKAKSECIYACNKCRAGDHMRKNKLAPEIEMVIAHGYKPNFGFSERMRK